MRLLALLALVFALGLLLGGCGSSKNGNPNNKITPNLTVGGRGTVPAGGNTQPSNSPGTSTGG